MTRLQLIKGRIAVNPVFAMLILALILCSSSVREVSFVEVGLILSIVFIGVVSLRRMRCALYLADKKSRVLVQHGSYSITRNPFYFFSFIGLLGIGLLTESFLPPLLMGLIFFLCYPGAIDMQETKLEELYGQEFDDYMARVPLFSQKSNY